MGEFGAVSVVSGHIRGQTNTLPLHVEILYNEYQFQAAFAVASLLALLALVTLVAKSVVEWRSRAARSEAAGPRTAIGRREGSTAGLRTGAASALWTSRRSRGVPAGDLREEAP
jgi:ABC-type Fe3+ transport system permease subunit